MGRAQQARVNTVVRDYDCLHRVNQRVQDARIQFLPRMQFFLIFHSHWSFT